MIHKLGERISSYRKERNMSQEELATVLNVSRQTISKWETGETLPDVYNTVGIAKMFHVTLDELILGVQGMLGGSSYLTELKQKRQKTNLRAIIVGSIGSTLFALAIILTKAFRLSDAQVGITMAFVLPVWMLCWAYAIWGFINTGRLNDEIKYLEQIEYTSMLVNVNSNDKNDGRKSHLESKI